MGDIIKLPLDKYAVKKHFVRFYFGRYPCSDECEEPIENWIVEDAIKMAGLMKGRKPYGFIFFTKGRAELDLDSKIIAWSPTYYFGGEITHVDKKYKDHGDEWRSEYTLIQNLKSAKAKRAITTVHGNGVILKDDDVVLGLLHNLIKLEGK